MSEHAAIRANVRIMDQLSHLEMYAQIECCSCQVLAIIMKLMT